MLCLSITAFLPGKALHTITHPQRHHLILPMWNLKKVTSLSKLFFIRKDCHTRRHELIWCMRNRNAATLVCFFSKKTPRQDYRPTKQVIDLVHVKPGRSNFSRSFIILSGTQTHYLLLNISLCCCRCTDETRTKLLNLSWFSFLTHESFDQWSTNHRMLN